jgi:hydrogenase maturation protease
VTSRILIAGIGNELMGDDALGPAMVARLAAHYEMPPELELLDLGLAGFDLLDFMQGRDAVVLIDSLDVPESIPGHVLRYGKAELTGGASSFRLSPHEQSLGQTLLAAELLGQGAAEVVLLGVVGKSFEMGFPLSDEVNEALPRLEAMLLDELRRLGIEVRRRPEGESELWH